MDLGDADLVPVRILGEGTFGRVFLCKCKQLRRNSGEQYCCVKRIIVQNSSKVQMKMVMEEVYIISQLNHPHIVQFIRSFLHAGTVNIVMEFISNGTLRDTIKRSVRNGGGLSKATVIQYFCDILMGLEYLHIRHVMHRDLKPENLLIDEKGRIKISDFGLSAICSPGKECSGTLGTPYYSAPEVLNGEKYDYKSDVWSVGCILYELCCGRSPFTKATTLSELRYLMRIMAAEKLNCSQLGLMYGNVLAKVCEEMLTYNVQKRISLPQVLSIDRSITIPFYKQYFEYEY